MRLHRPVSLGYLPADTGKGIARLSGLEGLTRSLLMGTVPLVALEQLGSKGAVSQAYAAGAALSLLITLNLGRLEDRMQRRFVVTLGIVALFSAAILFIGENTLGFVVALGLRSTAASTFSVMITLYVLDFIGKSELTRLESNRMVLNGLGWLIGPTLGLWLANNVDPAAPFVLSATLAIGLLGYYWWLRFEKYNVISEPKSKVGSPLSNVPRFFTQRYLRIAYVITFTRSLFWVALFVFAPIYIIEAGLPDLVAGAFLSLVAGLLLGAPLTRKLADRWGTRGVVSRGFFIVAASMLALGALGEPVRAGVLLWLAAAIGASMIDVVANIPFMRLVKPRERVAMATVFSTWRDMSALVSPLVAAIVLGAGLPFGAFLALLGIGAASAALVALRLPRRL